MEGNDASRREWIKVMAFKLGSPDSRVREGKPLRSPIPALESAVPLHLEYKGILYMLSVEGGKSVANKIVNHWTRRQGKWSGIRGHRQRWVVGTGKDG